MFGTKQSGRQSAKANRARGAVAPDAKLSRAPIQTNSRAFENDNIELDLDGIDGFAQPGGTVRVHTSNIRLVTKFFIATLSSLGLSISIYILIPSIPTYLSANLVPVISNLQSSPTPIDGLRPKVATANVSTKNIMNKAGTTTEAKLQNIAYSIIQSNDWDSQKLHFFKLAWVGLNQQQQNAIKDTIWFQMFESALRIKSSDALKNLSVDDESYTPKVRALLALALNLDVLKSRRRDVAPHYKESVENNEPSPETSDIDNTVVAKRQATSRTISIPDNAPKKQEISNEYRVQRVQPTVDIDPAHELSKMDLDRFEYALRPTYSELSDITYKFIDAYESGDVEKFSSLFTRNAISNQQNGRSGIKSQYEKIFASTTERQMFIHDLKWTFRKNMAVGKGTLELVVISKNETDVLTHKSRVQLVAERQKDQILIKRFYYLTD